MAEGKITVIRTKHNNQSAYFCMSTAAVQDENLSWEARGMLAYLLSKPSDWKVLITDLAQQCGKGRVYRILKELEDAKYLRKEQRRRPDQTFEPIEYRVYESPSLYEPLPEKPQAENREAAPLPEKPLTENPRAENREALLSIESQSIDKTLSVPIEKPAVSKKPDPMFEAIAKVWKTRGGAFVGNIRSMMLGISRKGDWKAANFDQPATADEVIMFGQWWNKHKPDLTIPNIPEKIQRYFYEFRGQRQRYLASQTAPVTTEKIEPVPTDAKEYVAWLSEQMGKTA